MPGIRVGTVRVVRVSGLGGVGEAAVADAGGERVRVHAQLGEGSAVVLGEAAPRVQTANALVGRGRLPVRVVDDVDLPRAREVLRDDSRREDGAERRVDGELHGRL